MSATAAREISLGGEAPGVVSPPKRAFDDRVAQLASLALMLLPGALVVALGFNAGGYFPGAPAALAIALGQILIARIAFARDPLEGYSRATLVAIAALATYAALTLASALWSHSLGRALVEFDRALVYLLVLVLFGSLPARVANVRWLIRGLALGCSIVCVAGLISRVAPDVWHTAPDVANERLSYPVTYWNALGLLAALGIVLAFHLTCTLTERRSVQVTAAAVLPLLAATLFFTFSRGAIAAGAIGLVVYVLVARPRGLLAGAIATVPASATLVVLAYRAKALDTVDPTTRAAVSQGHRLALAAALAVATCAGLRALLSARLDSRQRVAAPARHASPRARRAALVATVAAAVVAGLALGAPHALAQDWNRFFSGAVPHGSAGDLRQRLTDPSNNGRSELWRVALRGFSASPLHGRGAGMYQTLWDRDRALMSYTVNAHSLYLQAMAELGLPGLLALVVLVGSVLIGLARRARGRRRSIYAALLAAAIVWAIHAGLDWDWEMPVVTVGFFAAAGLALGPRGQRLPRRAPSGRARLLLALPCLAALVLPVLIAGSQVQLDRAKRALYANDCAQAMTAARSSAAWLGASSQPYEILGLCYMQRGQPQPALTDMRSALSRDPGSWEAYYMLALAQAQAGEDPRRAALTALRMNPLEQLTREAARVLLRSHAQQWPERARTLRTAALESKDLSIVPA